MIKTIEKRYCDCCGREISDTNVYTNFNGQLPQQYYTKADKDICISCINDINMTLFYEVSDNRFLEIYNEVKSAKDFKKGILHYCDIKEGFIKRSQN